jgi:phospholipid-binding lipoprotein MlaA
MGFRKTSEDFGQTFGVWGAEPGPYVVIPVFGPSTLRDTFGFVLDVALDPRDAVMTGARDQNIARGLVAIDRRRELLDTERTLDALSFDRYMAVRDAWLAHRRSQVYDGDPPPLPYKDE